MKPTKHFPVDPHHQINFDTTRLLLWHISGGDVNQGLKTLEILKPIITSFQTTPSTGRNQTAPWSIFHYTWTITHHHIRNGEEEKQLTWAFLSSWNKPPKPKHDSPLIFVHYLRKYNEACDLNWLSVFQTSNRFVGAPTFKQTNSEKGKVTVTSKYDITISRIVVAEVQQSASSSPLAAKSKRHPVSAIRDDKRWPWNESMLEDFLTRNDLKLMSRALGLQRTSLLAFDLRHCYDLPRGQTSTKRHDGWNQKVKPTLACLWRERTKRPSRFPLPAKERSWEAETARALDRPASVPPSACSRRAICSSCIQCTCISGGWAQRHAVDLRAAWLN